MPRVSSVVHSRKRKFYGPTALSLVDTTGIADPVQAVQSLTEQLLSDAEVTETPIPLEMLASFRGITKTEIRDMRESGRLIPLSNGEYRITLRASDPSGRQRFTLAHEIGHLLMPDYQNCPGPRVDGLTGEFAAKNEEEYFCDQAAMNLLLPEGLFRRRSAGISPSIDALFCLADDFQASIEATALRIESLSVWGCTPVVWEMALKPSQKQNAAQTCLFSTDEVPPPPEEFRVKFHAGKKGAYFPPSKHIPLESDLVQACLNDGVYRGRCVIPTANSDIECYAEAKSVQYRNENGVVSQRIISLVFV